MTPIVGLNMLYSRSERIESGGKKKAPALETGGKPLALMLQLPSTKPCNFNGLCSGIILSNILLIVETSNS